MQTLFNSYKTIFIEGKALDDISYVIKCLRTGDDSFFHQRRIFESFSTIFCPFHGGMTEPIDMQAFVSKKNNPKLTRFTEQCATLEKLTEHFAFTRNRENIQNKEEIIRLLEEFLVEFPPPKTFKKWVSE